MAILDEKWSKEDILLTYLLQGPTETVPVHQVMTRQHLLDDLQAGMTCSTGVPLVPGNNHNG